MSEHWSSDWNDGFAAVRPDIRKTTVSLRYGFSGRGGALLGAGARQDTLHAVIALVAGVLEERIGRTSQGDHQAPRFRPCLRVVDRDFVFQTLRSTSGEALDHMQLFAR